MKLTVKDWCKLINRRRGPLLQQLAAVHHAAPAPTAKLPAAGQPSACFSQEHSTGVRGRDKTRFSSAMHETARKRMA